MDTLAHAVYGATLCSRSGLAGGRRGPPAGRGGVFDWTVWAAAGFGALPDLASIGIHFAHALIRGEPPSFHGMPPYVFVLYRYTHSLLLAAFCVLVLRLTARPLVMPALAWPLHVITDSVLHDAGRWQTPLFFPLFDWRIEGINWWQHPRVVLIYWCLLPALWLAIYLWRRRAGAEQMIIGGGGRPPSRG